jgi:PhnB protein
MKWHPHLTFRGRCEEAFQFYEKALGAKLVTLIRYGDSPLAAETPAERHAHVLHATLTLGDNILMGADVDPREYQPPGGYYIVLDCESVAEAERLFGILAKDGNVWMPLQQTFWAARFAVLSDRFGTRWEINASK